MTQQQDKNTRLEFCAASREEWRAWLQENHSGVGEVWLVYYKKHTGKPSITYAESVEEALCFGWIDGIKKRIDDERYAHRFTPRKASSKWSPLNIKRARLLIGQGKMTPPGLACFDQRLKYDEDFIGVENAGEPTLPPETEKVLKSNSRAWDNFTALAPGYRKQYIGWLVTAKRPDTRAFILQNSFWRW
jgi:uncharacterized protein YdeI (YjbR/CyaY-like superfamily)